MRGVCADFRFRPEVIHASEHHCTQVHASVKKQKEKIGHVLRNRISFELAEKNELVSFKKYCSLSAYKIE